MLVQCMVTVMFCSTSLCHDAVMMCWHSGNCGVVLDSIVSL